MKFDTSPVKGTRDFLPEEMILRQKIIEKIKNIFEIFGFSPLETPALEKWEILAAKGAGGSEVLKETYRFKDKGGRDIGLRYDLTVPLARVIANNPNLQLPFKRYQIQKVWRYGDVKRGRLREFLQCDIDIVGTENLVADAEVIACAVKVLEELGFKNFFVRLNSRKLLTALVIYAGISKEKVLEVFRSIDKLDKIGLDGVKEELKEKGFSKQQISKIEEFLKISGEPFEILKQAEKLVGEIEEGKSGIKELRELVEYLKEFGVYDKIRLDLSLARGLDYYTGPIFEIWCEERGIGSLAGGGRYDELIGLFAGRKVPATGISLGIERILEILKERTKKIEKTKVKVFVAAATDDVKKDVFKIVKMLRENGIKTDFDLKGRKLKRQLEYADSLQIPFVVIVGKEELKEDCVRLRDMRKREERKVKINELIQTLTKS